MSENVSSRAPHAAAAVASGLARDLDFLLAAPFTVGAAWGCIMLASFSGATLVRIAAVLVELPRRPVFAPALAWAPFALWFAAGLLFAGLAARAARGRGPAPGNA